MKKEVLASGFKALRLSGFKDAARSLQLAVIFILFLVSPIFAKEVTIIYTGSTHAMLYPCSCPNEPDGGVARRATLIKQLRKDNPHTLVLDSGGFFAGGLMDEYTQNTQLDIERTMVSLRAMESMKYDAVAVGDDEFNFGREFWEENMGKVNLTFLSCNIESDRVSPYLIKEFDGTKIGIIGLTNPSSIQKAGGLKFVEPKLAVKQAVKELQKNNTNIIVLLSNLGEDDDLGLLKEIEGIDILIASHSRTKEKPSSKIGSTLALRPSWQGRRLGKLSLTLMNNKIIDYKVENLRLWDKISDDPDILSILPRCFSDNNCKKEGMIGMCQEPGTIKSQCIFTEASRINLLIITSKLCSVCDTERTVKYLKAGFSSLVISYLYYPDAQANKLIKDFNIKTLPVYLLGKEIEREKYFASLRENLEINPVRDYRTTEKISDVSNGVKGDFYMLKPQFSGIAYFLDRKEVKGRLDLFISLYDNYIPELLETIKEFNPTIHFLAIEQPKDRFDAAKGNLEAEEYLRAVCVEKYYPKNFWDYISCRAKSINSSWWEDCLPAGQAGLGKMDIAKIRTCARGEEGKSLLKENTNLNKELGIMFGPAYLLDNQEIFGTQGVPAKEELKRIIQKR